MYMYYVLCIFIYMITIHTYKKGLTREFDKKLSCWMKIKKMTFWKELRDITYISEENNISITFD